MFRSMTCSLVLTVLLSAAPGGCSEKKYRRAQDTTEIDYYTTNLKFEQRDANQLHNEIRGALLSSSIVEQWNQSARTGTPPRVAVFPVENHTSEQIRSQLDTLPSKFDTDLVNETSAEVVPHKQLKKRIEKDREKRKSSVFDKNRLIENARQFGAQYLITGNVRDVTERVMACGACTIFYPSRLSRLKRERSNSSTRHR